MLRTFRGFLSSYNHMNRKPGELSPTSDVWRRYRVAFDEFSRRVQHIQVLSANANGDRGNIDAALLELEKARVAYNDCRSALARQLLPSSSSELFPAVSPDTPKAYANRTRKIAQLLWEIEGKPDGTANEDWHRAEEIIRRASAA
jgi:hypothetical protein